jgi:hypothetical protein
MMRKIVIGTVLGITTLVGALATPATAATPWASLVSISRPIAANSGVPLNPSIRRVSVRATYYCRPVAPWYYRAIRATVYRPSTQATYQSNWVQPLTCDGHTHTSPALVTACCKDAAFRTGESVRVTIAFRAFGSPIVSYYRWTTVALGTIPYPS